jgi:dTDP-4-dehydrorhamnose reductase
VRNASTSSDDPSWQLSANTGVILVVGGDSAIGRALVARLERDGKAVVATSRRHESTGSSRVFLDLSQDMDDWQLPGPVSAAIICAGVTKIEECRRDPALTAHINVDSVVKLINRLASAGAFTIYLSTNQVFDGSVPQRPPNDMLSPQTEYGRQKAEVERQIGNLARNVGSVVRLTKVLGPQSPLLQSWVNALRNAEVIHPFRDMVMSPVSLCFVITVLERLCERQLPGIFQVSSDEEVTYAHVAYYLAEKMELSRELVQPIDSTAAGIPRAAVPPHTSLDVERLRTELGLEPPSVWTTIDNAVRL